MFENGADARREKEKSRSVFHIHEDFFRRTTQQMGHALSAGTMRLPMATLYDQIGASCISEVIREFYLRAFQDPIIGHFFHRSDRERLTLLQTEFATAMLGGPKKYTGKDLLSAHAPFKIKPVHFNRRQVLMQEVLREYAVEKEAAARWLALEERFRDKILTDAGSCHD